MMEGTQSGGQRTLIGKDIRGISFRYSRMIRYRLLSSCCANCAQTGLTKGVSPIRARVAGRAYAILNHTRSKREANEKKCSGKNIYICTSAIDTVGELEIKKK